MPTRRRLWLLVAIALLSAVGVWLGHTLEYIRVWGTGGLEQEISGSVHLYMVPAGLGLTVLLAAAAATLGRLRAGLGERAARASALLARPWHALVPPAARSEEKPRPHRSALAVFATLGTTLATVQVGLYLFQENAETALAGVPVPGLSAVSGVHWAAPLIQVGVGLALAAVATAVWVLLRRDAEAVERVERAVRRVLAVLAARRGRSVTTPLTAPRRVYPLPELLGSSIWCRPPPLSLTV
jgi:hypothetical protein